MNRFDKESLEEKIRILSDDSDFKFKKNPYYEIFLKLLLLSPISIFLIVFLLNKEEEGFLSVIISFCFTFILISVGVYLYSKMISKKL